MIDYDQNGNIVYDQESNVYREYNELNQLIRTRINNISGTILQEYTYEPLQERIFIKDEVYSNGSLKSSTYYFGDDYIVIQNSSGTFNETYIYQDGILVGYEDTDGKKRYVLPDHEGSIHIVLDENGNVLEENLFSPFAEPLEGVKENKFSYESKEYDSLVRDYDFHFRKYNPKIRIYGQPDSLIQNVYDPQSLNRYNFERSNPYRHVDSDGHFFWIPWVVGAAAGLIHAGYYLYNNPGDYSGAFAHGATTFATTTASIYLPVARVASGGLRLLGGVSGGLFGLGATDSLIHSSIDRKDFTSASTYWNALGEGAWNVLGGKFLNYAGVPGITGYKPGQFYPSGTFSAAMFREFFSQSIITGTPPVVSTSLKGYQNIATSTYEYFRYQYYFSDEADASSGFSGGSSGGRGGGGGGCRCGPYGNLREEAQNAKPGEKAEDIIKRWRKKN